MFTVTEGFNPSTGQTADAGFGDNLLSHRTMMTGDYIAQARHNYCLTHAMQIQSKQLACLMSGVFAVALFVAIGCDDKRSDASKGEAVVVQEKSSVDATTTPAPNEAAQEIDLKDIVGTWRATGVDAPMGSVTILLDIRDTGKVEIEADSNVPFVGEVRDKVRSFTIENGKLRVPNLRDGVTMPLEMVDANTMILEYKPGQRVEFNRIESGATD